MRFEVKDSLSEREIRQGLGNVIKDGIASQAMTTLTSGIFMVAFALTLGASNTIIGLLAAIPPFAHLFQIPAIYLVQKYKNRRATTIYSAALSRMFWLFIACIPFIFIGRARLNFLIIALLFNSLFAAVSGCSWNSWMRDLVPQEKLGTFFSRRMKLAAGIGLTLSLAGGFYLDYWSELLPKYQVYSYSVLFSFGFFAGMVGLYFLRAIPEPRMQSNSEGMNFSHIISKPFSDINFRRLFIFLGSWNFAVNLAAPFFLVYMLKWLQLKMSLVIGLTVLSQLMNISFYQIWGKLSDRFSNKSVLLLCGPLFMLCILGWTFTTMPEKYVLTIPLLIILHIFMGISIAGVTLAAGNIALRVAPKDQGTAYLAGINIINSLAAGSAPILGGAFADFFAKRELSLDLTWISPDTNVTVPALNLRYWDFFFFFAFLIGLYSIHRLALVREFGKVEDKIKVNTLLSEVKNGIKTHSTIGGLRHMVYFPFWVIKTTFKRRK
jgi:MFS family permease